MTATSLKLDLTAKTQTLFQRILFQNTNLIKGRDVIHARGHWSWTREFLFQHGLAIQMAGAKSRFSAIVKPLLPDRISQQIDRQEAGPLSCFALFSIVTPSHFWGLSSLGVYSSHLLAPDHT